MSMKIPNVFEILQMAIKYSNTIQSKALQNIPQWGFFGMKIPTPSGNPGRNPFAPCSKLNKPWLEPG
jgi:hypothetical protein